MNLELICEKSKGKAASYHRPLYGQIHHPKVSGDSHRLD